MHPQVSLSIGKARRVVAWPLLSSSCEHGHCSETAGRRCEVCEVSDTVALELARLYRALEVGDEEGMVRSVKALGVSDTPGDKAAGVMLIQFWLDDDSVRWDAQGEASRNHANWDPCCIEQSSVKTGVTYSYTPWHA